MACLCTWGSHIMNSGQVKCCEQNQLSKFNVKFSGHLKEKETTSEQAVFTGFVVVVLFVSFVFKLGFSVTTVCLASLTYC